MKTLLILRHAKSDWSKPGMADHDRPLNDRGKRDAPRMGKLLASLGIVPDAIISSTAKRARRTADKVAKKCGYEGAVDTTSTFYLAHPDQYIQYLHQLPGDPPCVMVVGHNPGLEDLVEALTGQFQRMPTGAMAHLEFPLESWQDLRLNSPGRLVNLWRPKEVEL